MNLKEILKKPYALTAIIGIAILAFLLYRDFRREELMDRMLQQQMMNSGRGTGKGEGDHYLQNEVKNTILKGYRELQSCYKDYLKSSPKITDGEIKIDWQVKENGSVENTQIIISQFADEAFKKCMTDNISKWEFPEPPIKKYVVHTFKFSDEKKDAKK